MTATRQDIGTDPEAPYIAGAPLDIRIPFYICGLPSQPDIDAWQARWRLNPYLGFGLGEPVLTKETGGSITIDGAAEAFIVHIAYQETASLKHLHRHTLWVSSDGVSWTPGLVGDFQITPDLPEASP